MFAAAAATVLNYQVYNYRRERRLLLLKNIPAQSSRDEIENLCRGQLDDTGSFVLFWLPVVDSLTHQHPGWAMLGFPSRRATALALHRLRGLSQHGQALQFVRASRRQRLRRGRGAARRNDMPRELTAPDEPPAPFHPAPLPPSPPNPPFWSLSRQPRRTTIEVVEQLLPWASAQMLLFVAGIPSGVAKDEFDDAFKRLLARDHATLSLRLRPEGLPQPEHSQGVFLLVTTGQPSSWYLYDRLRTLTVAGRGLVVSQVHTLEASGRSHLQLLLLMSFCLGIGANC